MPEIVNQQRKIKLEIDCFQKFADLAVAAVSEAHARTFTVAFVSDQKMLELNRFFRDVNKTTDVLSFLHEPEEFESKSYAFTRENEEGLAPEGVTPTFLGDIVISVEQARRQAEENGLILENEIKQLILHGLLHLCGYDHETDNGEMNTRELDLREKLGI